MERMSRRKRRMKNDKLILKLKKKTKVMKKIKESKSYKRKTKIKKKTFLKSNKRRNLKRSKIKKNQEGKLRMV